MKVFVDVKRRKYEEPYNTEIEISVSNGAFMGNLTYYCKVDDLNVIAKRLQSFPSGISDEFKYELGSENIKDRFAYYFLMCAFVRNNSGHCALHFRINTNGTKENPGLSDFVIPVEAAHVNQLGDLYAKLAGLELEEFKWSPQS